MPVFQLHARPRPSRILTHGFLPGLLLLPSACLALTLDIVGPSGSGSFGRSIRVLANGNFIVTDPLYDAPGPVADVGAVYVYTPAGVLLSTLTGSTAGDQVGNSGIAVLANGRFAVLSPFWNGTAAKTGAVTWGNMTTGISGTVSAANSLTGTRADDQVGIGGIVVLTNGNCIVRSPLWHATRDGNPVANAGAVTWCDGVAGRTGAVTGTNSLTGGRPNDQVGGSSVIPLTNGHYVVGSPLWDSTLTDVGAVTWGNGSTGIAGPVSASNSLVGSTASDTIGLQGITALTNGNYVVNSPNWDNGSVFNAGAVTWGNGSTGLSGTVSASNSLTSNGNFSRTGSGGVTPLTNGNYVVGSPSIFNSTGAVTWCHGATGRSEAISAANSFLGSDPNDFFGGFPGGVVALTDGNFVTWSPNWTRPDHATTSGTSTGAVTWGNGSTGLTGTASAANSLIGGTSGAGIGSSVTPLAGGKFVVASFGWEENVLFPSIVNRGAITFCADGAACRGVVGSTNSLIGEADDDGRGYNYQIGSYGVLALTNGNYVIRSPEWGKASFAFPLGVPRDCGAVTWAAGRTGGTATVGTLNPTITATGGTDFERIGGNVTALANGHYVISSNSWHAGAATNAGAVRWCDGTTGAVGPTSDSNSLTGSTANDALGTVFPLSDGNYVVFSSSWDNPAGSVVNAGSLTFCSGTGGTTGPVNSSNSVVGTATNGGSSMTFDYDAARRQMIVGRPASNLVTLWAAAAAATIPQLNPPVLLAGGSIRLSFTGIPGTAYILITSKDLDRPYSQWESLGRMPEISSGQFEYTSPPSSDPRAFFSVRVP